VKKAKKLKKNFRTKKLTVETMTGNCTPQCVAGCPHLPQTQASLFITIATALVN